jgi:hypothetical protein
MYRVTLVVLVLVWLVPCGHAQSDLNPNGSASNPAIRDVTCPDPIERSACNSFMELVRAGDSSVGGLVLPTHSRSALSFVCFTDAENSFFTVRYANLPAQPRNWFMTLNAYTNGLTDGSGGLGVWARYQVTGREPVDDLPLFPIDMLDGKSKTITVTDSELEVTANFTNVGKGQTTKVLTIQLHTGRFRISGTYDEPPTKPGAVRESGLLPEATGRCINLWQYVNDSAPAQQGTLSQTNSVAPVGEKSTGWSSEEAYTWETYVGLNQDDRAYVRAFCAANPVGVAKVPEPTAGGPPPSHAISCSSWLSAKSKAPH